MPVLFAPSPAVPGQPMNFRAEAKSETSIGLSWSPPRQESIIKYELLFREGDHGREVRGGVGGGGRRAGARPRLPLWATLLSPRACAGMSLFPPSLCPCPLLIFPPLTLFSFSISITL